MRVNKVLAIAITDYDDAELNKIENCYDDVRGILAVINEKYSFDEIVFLDKKEDTTRKSLYSRLNDYFINTLPEDNVLLLFAGHGEYNKNLGMAYWQPSDADPSDPSSWLNINDVLAFVKAAKAFHISIISDSCFAGAIFEPPGRGGGMDALKTKRSREALTSGGIEKVSDGKKGEKSPFARTLIKILSENEKKDLPFNVFSNNVILEFDRFKKQTPRFGSLNDVGHDGGTFVFELKEIKKENEEIKDKNEYLKDEMGNLFIQIPTETLDDVEKITEIKVEKNKLVRQQHFEEAASIRDQEKLVEEKMKKDSELYIDSLVSDMKFSNQEITQSKQLDSNIEEYNKSIEEQRTLYENERAKNEEEKETILEEATSEGSESLSLPSDIAFGIEASLSEFSLLFSTKENPADKYFNENQEILLNKYKENIISLYKYFKQLQAVSTSTIIREKATLLREILLNIYTYEIDILTGRMHKKLETELKKKEIEISLLSWLSNKK